MAELDEFVDCQVKCVDVLALHDEDDDTSEATSIYVDALPGVEASKRKVAINVAKGLWTQKQTPIGLVIDVTEGLLQTWTGSSDMDEVEESKHSIVSPLGVRDILTDAGLPPIPDPARQQRCMSTLTQDEEQHVAAAIKQSRYETEDGRSVEVSEAASNDQNWIPLEPPLSIL